MIKKYFLAFLSLFIFLFLNPIKPQTKISEVTSVIITVSDMKTILPFYTNVLHFEFVKEDTLFDPQYSRMIALQNSFIHLVKLKMGEEFIELIDFISPEGNIYPANSHSNDLWFQHIAIITNNMDSAYAWLKLNDVKNISIEPQRLPDWNKSAGGIKAFYFQDPDGHPLEILEYPPEKGNAKWHKSSKQLFLGIDHTAIAVSNTDESLKFYRDVLGMEVGGESENYGIEQARLNNVENAHLKITGLHAEIGPGIEFLQYLFPNTYSPYPKNVSANDLIHWMIELKTNDIERIFENLKAKNFKTYSRKVLNSIKAFGLNKAFIVQDPDGHRLLIYQNSNE